MNKPTFLNQEKPLLTVMVAADTPQRISELVKASVAEGAEAFGMQFCKLKKEYRTKETYKKLFAEAAPLPVYVTNYRAALNDGTSDEELAEGLLELAECGATLCDVMGDQFDACEDELTMNEEAVKKQMKLIDDLHAKGAEVLISSHIQKFVPAEQVLEIALEHQRRGADICKIVTKATTLDEQLENMRTIALLKKTLKIPFLFLCAGECHILRRVGGSLGSCMYLCVHEYDKFSTNIQPLLRNMKAIRDNF